MLGLLLIFGALAEFERNLIRERTQPGLTAARARGKKGGRPKFLTVQKRSIARELYDTGHTIGIFARRSRSPERRCTGRSSPQTQPIQLDCHLAYRYAFKGGDLGRSLEEPKQA